MLEVENQKIREVVKNSSSTVKCSEGGNICAKEVHVAQFRLYTSFTDTSSFLPSIQSVGDEKEGTTYSEHYGRRGS
jgi:hypothetical protein